MWTLANTEVLSRNFWISHKGQISIFPSQLPSWGGLFLQRAWEIEVLKFCEALLISFLRVFKGKWGFFNTVHWEGQLWPFYIAYFVHSCSCVERVVIFACLLLRWKQESDKSNNCCSLERHTFLAGGFLMDENQKQWCVWLCVSVRMYKPSPPE